MDIPLELLIDYMGYLNPDVRIKKRNMWINGIKMLPEQGVLDPNYVYFSQYTKGALPSENSVVVWICPRTAEEIPETDNCIILHTDVSVAVVFNEMLGYQNLIRSWRQEIELSISRREGAQRLLDISVRVFGNPIAIITTSFKTIAATWEFETEDALFWELLELGYLTQKTFNHLQEFGYFSSEHFSGETVLHKPNDVVNSDSAMTAVLHDGSVVFMVLMLYSNNPPSRGLFQLYKLLVDKLKYYLQPAAASGDYLRNQQDYFIVDIIEGRITTPREIAERSLVYPPAFTTEYYTVLISHESSSAMYLEHAMNNLSALFPNVRQLLHNGEVLLYPDLSVNALRKANFLNTLSNYLQSVQAYAGISEPHKGLITLKESYRQAKEALTLGRRLSRTKLSEDMMEAPDTSSRTFHFSGYHMYSLLGGKEKDIGVLDNVRKYDLEHQTSYYRIMFVFLSLERSFTKAAAVLEMHRNNVIYHTKRISEIFGFDFDDPVQRLRLLMLYRLGDLLSE